MDSFRVSVIIPIYNVEPYIKACLQSLANQTWTESIECILIDDYGTDNSVEIAEHFIRDYKGNITFRICHHDENKGLSAARNTGIRAAKGEYVYFLDSDDTIISNCIATFIKIIDKHPHVDLIQGLIDQDSDYMNQFTQKKMPAFTKNRKYIKKSLLDYDELPVCAANKMVRRNLIIENDIFFKEGIIHEDNYWSFFLAKHVRSLAVYPEKCYLYTVNPKSITKAVNLERETNSHRVMIEDFCSNVDDFMRGEQKRCIFLVLNSAISNHYYKAKDDRKYLVNCLSVQCNPIEKGLLSLWSSDSSIKTNVFRLLLKLFRLL